MKSGRRRYALGAFIAAQSIIVGLVLAYGLNAIFRLVEQPSIRILFMWLILCGVIAGSIGISMVHSNRNAKRQLLDELIKIHIKSTEDLLANLRMQRHAFVNHLQVLYGLVQLGQLENAKEYVRHISEEVCTGGPWPELSNHPELSALVYSRFRRAEMEEIAASCEVRADFGGLAVCPYELATVVGVLLDNAIEALVGVEGEKKLALSVNDSGECLQIEVWDSEGPIPDEVLSRLFEMGFTTKKRGSGFGLAVCKTIVEQSRGSIDVETSAQAGTTFRVRLPKTSDPRGRSCRE